MANEAALPTIGWLALLSLPAVGLWLDRKTGVAIGGISAALIAAGSTLTSFNWIRGGAIDIEDAFSGTGYLLSLAWITLFSWPAGFIELKTATASLIFLTSMAAAVALQVSVMRRWGKEGLLKVFGAQVVLLGSYWIFRSYYKPVEIELGYTGIIEIMGYMNSIMVCAISALCIIAFDKRRKHNLSV